MATQRGRGPVTLKVSGPLFDDRTGHLVRKAAEDAVRELVERGEEYLNEQGRPRPGGVFLSVVDAGRKASVGNWRRSLNAVARGLQGRIDDGGIIYGPWLEDGGNRNTRFRGYGLFRKTKQKLDREAPQVLRKVAANLTRKLGGR